MQLKDCCKLSLSLRESVKLGALRAKNELACQRAFRAYVLTFQRVLCAYVLTCQRTLRSYMPTCLGCSLAHMSTCLACLRAYMALHALRSHLFTCQRAVST